MLKYIVLFEQYTLFIVNDIILDCWLTKLFDEDVIEENIPEVNA